MAEKIDVDSIVKRIVENPTEIEKLSEEEILLASTRMNPVGTVAGVKKTFAVMSVVNMREEYLRRFLMTSLVGFMFRSLSEYVPRAASAAEERCAAEFTKLAKMQRPIDVTEEDWKQKIQKARDDIAASTKKFTDAKIAADRAAIADFLREQFVFNPDKHARKNTKYTEGAAVLMADPSKDAAAKEFTAAVAADADRSREAAAAAAAISVGEQAVLAAEAAGQLSRAARIVEKSAGMVADIARRVVAAGGDKSLLDVSNNALRQQVEAANIARIVTENVRVSNDDGFAVAAAAKFVPPADVFHHFGRYIDSHYESLRLITNELYEHYPSDIDNCVMFCDAFPDAESAQRFIRAHESEFSVDPKIIENGGVTLLGPFRENRERVDFYTKNTEVLRAMAEQLKDDHKIGQEIVQKRIEKSKARNIRETGEDAPGLEGYIKNRGIVASMGKKPQLSAEDKRKLAEAARGCAEFEGPEGAMPVEIIAPEVDEENGVVKDLKHSFIYSAAEQNPVGKQ